VLYEAGGGGFAESEDFGESWRAVDEGMRLHYAWGLAVDSEDPALVYASAAPGPYQAHGSGFSDAAIYRRRDGGRWELLVDGLAAFPYALAADPEAPGAVFAGFGDGEILRSPDAGANWYEVVRVPAVEALAIVQV
jgi:hypothetical protein